MRLSGFHRSKSPDGSLTLDIFRKSFEPPRGLETEAFVIFPTDVSYFEPDYRTVMKCQKSLKLWSQSEWPEDSFNAEENKQDLQAHVEDNIKHSAYGFMIFSPDRTKCYGSLYVNPIGPVILNYKMTDLQRRALSQIDARVDFWTNSECEDESTLPELDRLLTKRMHRWFTEEWKIRAAFSARRGMVLREKLYLDLGLKPIADITKIEVDGSSVSLLLFN